jgi:hypothetical protein
MDGCRTIHSLSAKHVFNESVTAKSSAGFQ